MKYSEAETLAQGRKLYDYFKAASENWLKPIQFVAGVVSVSRSGMSRKIAYAYIVKCPPSDIPSLCHVSYAIGYYLHSLYDNHHDYVYNAVGCGMDMVWNGLYQTMHQLVSQFPEDTALKVWADRQSNWSYTMV